MKRYIYALVALALLSVEGLSAQMKTSYFMEGSYFRTEMNPALAPTRGYVALPFVSGFDFGLSGNVLSVDNFVYQTDKGLVTALNGAVSSDEFLSRLPEIGLESLKADIIRKRVDRGKVQCHLIVKSVKVKRNFSHESKVLWWFSNRKEKY